MGPKGAPHFSLHLVRPGAPWDQRRTVVLRLRPWPSEEEDDLGLPVRPGTTRGDEGYGE